MQEELLQFKMQKVWVLVDLPKGKRAIGLKWVFRNKNDERGIVICRGHTQEEDIDYDEIFALVAKIEAIRLFLAYASFMDFMVYQMDVKSAFLYETIGEEVYVCQPLGFEDPDYSDKVYKVVKALYGLHQAPRASKELASPKQTTLGVNTPRCDEDSLELMKLMVFMIMDFLNAHAIQYALVVNLTIYVSCIKQFWVLATLKKVNEVVQLRALIDGKKVVVTEDVIRQDLHLDDADGVGCLLNEEIFAELARMGYEKPPPKLTFYKAFYSAQWKFLIHTLVQCISAKRTAWNEFSCSMASAVICLAIRRKFNFSKYIFDNMGRILCRYCYGCSQGYIQTRGGEIKAINADEDITLVDVETQVDMDAELQGRRDQDVSAAATKDVNAAEPTVFDDEEYDDKEENIKWNAGAEQIQEKHLDNIKKYQSLKRKPVSIAQARKNMIIYLKNMVGYTMEHFREEPTKKRVSEETLLYESFKKLKAVEVSGSNSIQETPSNDPKEMSQEDVQNMLEFIPVFEFKSFEDMLKGFDREDLVALWSLVKENFNSAVPNVDKEKALWVELKRLFEPDVEDVLWKLQRERLSLFKWSHNPDAECKVTS
nr:copia protein [Tanacetum cinerariifolium]GEX52367.1 copia protein [Tanacetum cinerariifolium]